MKFPPGSQYWVRLLPVWRVRRWQLSTSVHQCPSPLRGPPSHLRPTSRGKNSSMHVAPAHLARHSPRLSGGTRATQQGNSCPAPASAGQQDEPQQLVQIARQSPPDCRRHSFLNSGMRRCLVWAWGTSIIGSSRAIEADWRFVRNLGICCLLD